MRASSATPRIVSVSTFVHTESTGFRWSDPNYLKEEEYDGYTSYKDSKVLVILFASALARRSGGKIDSYSLNPGCEYRWTSPAYETEFISKGFTPESRDTCQTI